MSVNGNNNIQSFIDILCDKYNNGQRYDIKIQHIALNKVLKSRIEEWLDGYDNDVEYERLLKAFLKAYRPSRMTKKQKTTDFGRLRLNYAPKFNGKKIQDICRDCAQMKGGRNKTNIGMRQGKCDICWKQERLAAAYHDFGIDEDGKVISDQAFAISNSM